MKDVQSVLGWDFVKGPEKFTELLGVPVKEVSNSMPARLILEPVPVPSDSMTLAD